MNAEKKTNTSPNKLWAVSLTNKQAHITILDQKYKQRGKITIEYKE